MSFTPTELIMLLIRNSREQRIKGRTRFQKIVFLLEEQGINFGYQFKPYLYGPYSRDLQDNITMLTELRLITEESEEIKFDGIIFDRYTYSLSEEGRGIIERIERNNPDTSRRMEELIDNIQDLSTGSLILSSKYIMSESLSR